MFGIDVGRLEQRSRPLLRPCLDWSERRYHLAGSLGALPCRPGVAGQHGGARPLR